MSQITYPSSSPSSSQIHTSSNNFRSDSSKNSAGRFALLLARTASAGDSKDAPEAIQGDPEANEPASLERPDRRSATSEQPSASRTPGNRDREKEEPSDADVAAAADSPPSETTPQTNSDEALAAETPAPDAPASLLPAELPNASEGDLVDASEALGKGASTVGNDEGVAEAATTEEELAIENEGRTSPLDFDALLGDERQPAAPGTDQLTEQAASASPLVEPGPPTETAGSKEGPTVEAGPAPPTSPFADPQSRESLSAAASDAALSDRVVADPTKEIVSSPAADAVDSRDAPGKPDTNVSPRADTSVQFAADRVLPPSPVAESTGNGVTAPDASEAAARPETGQPLRIVDRVRRAFLAAQRRGAPLRIRLHPPELGSLKLELHVQRGVVKARMETDTAAAQSILSDHVSALKDRLAESGLKVDTFEVAWRQPGQGGETFQEGESFRQGHRAPHFAGRSGRALETESAEEKSARAVVDLRAGRLNVKV